MKRVVYTSMDERRLGRVIRIAEALAGIADYRKVAMEILLGASEISDNKKYNVAISSIMP